MKKEATLSIEGKTVASFPIIEGTEAPHAIDIRQMLNKTQMVTYDPGFVSTASCRSKITFIDGDKGVLKYRGHEVEDLVKSHNFLSVVFSLLNGKLPDSGQASQFNAELAKRAFLDEAVVSIIHTFPMNAHPMSVLIAAFAALDSLCPGSENARGLDAIAKVPLLVASVYAHLYQKPAPKPDPSLGYTENFLNMLFGKADPVISKAVDIIFTLHADHEQNASTSSVRASASAGANIFACLASGVATLSGPAHGGANEAVIKMIEEIGSVSEVPAFVQKAKDQVEGVRLMGFGHRVYKNYDPRAKILKAISGEVLDRVGQASQNEKLLIAHELEQIALKDQYFIERKLYPNVDFYSGIILEAIGIPHKVFTALFALARTSGWVSQYLEAIQDPEQRIYRPRQLYQGD